MQLRQREEIQEVLRSGAGGYGGDGEGRELRAAGGWEADG